MATGPRHTICMVRPFRGTQSAAVGIIFIPALPVPIHSGLEIFFPGNVACESDDGQDSDHHPSLGAQHEDAGESPDCNLASQVSDINLSWELGGQ